MKKKLIIPVILALILIGSILLRNQRNSAKEVQFSIEVEDKTVKKGDDLNLKIKVSSDYEMSVVDAYITYDDELLEFISSESEGVLGASGTLHITDQFAKGATEAVYVIRMKALEVGSADFKVHDAYSIDAENSSYMKIKQTSASIDITKNETEISNATLSDLLVMPGTLDKEFQPEMFEYSMKVAYDVEEVILSAIPESEESVITIDKELNLTKGDNIFTITVTAPSGDRNDYKLNVYRAFTKDEIVE
nr:cadherin-like beta sandwich domain-containing protein [uncultured Anaerosporobacter sp.]